MSTIDEIMGQVNDYARAWADAQTAEMGDRINAYAYRAEERAALRELIAAAIADARREGAEQMREACADRVEECDQETERWEYAEYIRALPLSTGPRQAVRLTDVQISDARALALNTAPDSVSMGRVAGLDNRQLRELARAIETAVLAANGMGDSND